jgi:phospholipid/cholesterol/gamma-HCH transport system permease protein
MATTAIPPRTSAPERLIGPDAVGERLYQGMRGAMEQTGDMVVLTGQTIASALRPPYPYGIEFVQQFLFVLRACWFPMLVSTIAFGYEAPGFKPPTC